MNQTTEKPAADPTESSLSPVPSVPSESSADLERLTAENDRLRSDLRLHSAREMFVSTLNRENARSPQLLFDASIGRFAFTEDGQLDNAEELIADIRNRFPEQFKTDEIEKVDIPIIQAGAGRSDHRPPLTRESLAQMTPQDIARLDWNDVKQVLSQ